MHTTQRREFLRKAGSCSLASAVHLKLEGATAQSRPARLADVGWVWEGQGWDPGVFPSIFGVGEGAEYFGLRRAVFIFHPTTELALDKLRGLEEVVCDISKWKFRRTKDGGTQNWVDGSPEAVRAEAKHLSRLSLSYPNVIGGFHDDMLGLLKRHGYGPSQYREIYEALRSDNPKLKLWVVVYTHELDADWSGYLPYIDVVNLWIWESKNIPSMERAVARCREVFPGKPINMGCYLRDYTLTAPVPMDRLKMQWRMVLEGISRGSLSGFSILAGVLIDGHQEQARWIRDFIAAN